MTQDWPLVRFVGEADIFNVPIRNVDLAVTAMPGNLAPLLRRGRLQKAAEPADTACSMTNPSNSIAARHAR
jgi:hypothetical protein